MMPNRYLFRQLNWAAVLNGMLWACSSHPQTVAETTKLTALGANAMGGWVATGRRTLIDGQRLGVTRFLSDTAEFLREEELVVAGLEIDTQFVFGSWRVATATEEGRNKLLLAHLGDVAHIWDLDARFTAAPYGQGSDGISAALSRSETGDRTILVRLGENGSSFSELRASDSGTPRFVVSAFTGVEEPIAVGITSFDPSAPLGVLRKSNDDSWRGRLITSTDNAFVPELCGLTGQSLIVAGTRFQNFENDLVVMSIQLSDFSVEWTKRISYGEKGVVRPADLRVRNDEIILLAGFTTESSKTSAAPWVLRLSPSGTLLGEARYFDPSQRGPARFSSDATRFISMSRNEGKSADIRFTSTKIRYDDESTSTVVDLRAQADSSVTFAEVPLAPTSIQVSITSNVE